MSQSPFSAAASTIGYIYQCRYALLESLRRLPMGDEFMVYLETLDDIVFETEEEGLEILQTKHHTRKDTRLTDASTDLWKTLRIWVEGLNDGSIVPESTFFLITTGQALGGSAAAYLKAEGTRDSEKAVQRLMAVARSSTNRVNEPAYKVFRELSDQRRANLIESIHVVDSAPIIADIDKSLRERLFFVAELNHLDSLIDRLEGWWFRRIVKHLVDPQSLPILSEELQAETNRLRDQFQEDNLPIDDDILEATVDATGYQDKGFVYQLRLIGIGNKRIFHAIRNYFRAFEQRSRWIRESLIMVGDLSRYEQSLVEEWELHFEQMREEVGYEATEETKKEAAQRLYKWIETGSHPVIRPHCVQPFVARGTFQMLADSERVGWHPEFANRLRGLLEMQSVEV